LRAATRWALWPLVLGIKHPAPAALLILLGAWLFIRARRARGHTLQVAGYRQPET
jgi:hypothetical protein